MSGCSSLPWARLISSSQTKAGLNQTVFAAELTSCAAMADNLSGAVKARSRAWDSSNSLAHLLRNPWRPDLLLAVKPLLHFLIGRPAIGGLIGRTGKKAERAGTARRGHRHQLDHRLAGLGHHNRPAFHHLLNEPRQMGLGLVYVEHLYELNVVRF